jgi:molybdopterin converting factor small subunit
MKIKVILYGRYSEIVGEKELEINVKGNTIWDVIDKFVKKYSAIEKDKKFIMVLKNNTYTSFDENIEEGDTITISPPVVSGG